MKFLNAFYRFFVDDIWVLIGILLTLVIVFALAHLGASTQLVSGIVLFAGVALVINLTLLSAARRELSKRTGS